MAVVIETTLGDITVDLFTQERPQTCKNFLKLCKIKYYNFCLFHSVQANFLAQTGDPSGVGTGGESIYGIVHGGDSKFYEGEKMPKIKHDKPGLLSMVNCGNNMLGSQFFVTLGSDLHSLEEHCVFAEVTEGHDVLVKLNDAICDYQHRPYQDIRITHTVILEDPFDDPPGLIIPEISPSVTQMPISNGRIGADEKINDEEGLTTIELEEMKADREAKARATILEIVGDIPDAEIAPPENVLFVCKLNPVTTDEDLEIIFSRFGKVKSCEVIRDHQTGDSLQYAFVEFEDQKSCEQAYLKMDNVLIDDRRIHVDFSQSVSKMKWRGKGRGVQYFDKPDEKESNRSAESRYSGSRRDNYRDRDRDRDRERSDRRRDDERRRRGGGDRESEDHRRRERRKVATDDRRTRPDQDDPSWRDDDRWAEEDRKRREERRREEERRGGGRTSSSTSRRTNNSSRSTAEEEVRRNRGESERKRNGSDRVRTDKESRGDGRKPADTGEPRSKEDTVNSREDKKNTTKRDDTEIETDKLGDASAKTLHVYKDDVNKNASEKSSPHKRKRKPSESGRSKKKRNRRDTSSSDSSTSDSSDSSSSSSSVERKKKTRRSLTVAKKYYQGGKLVKVVKKKRGGEEESSDSDTGSEESSESDHKRRRSKKYKKKIVKVVMKKKKRRPRKDRSSDDSDSDSSSSDNSDSSRYNNKKKRRKSSKGFRKKKKSSESKKNKKKSRATSESSEEPAEDLKADGRDSKKNMVKTV